MGSSGGLFLCWSSQVVVSVIVVAENFIFCKVQAACGNEYFTAFVYGSPIVQNRPQVWDNLKDLMVGLDKVVLVGDSTKWNGLIKKWGVSTAQEVGPRFQIGE